MPTDDEVEAIAAACGTRLTELLPRRASVSYDPATGIMRMGDQAVAMPGNMLDNDTVLGAYIGMVRRQRGLRPDQDVKVRQEDLEALGEALDLDDDELEERLVRVIGMSRTQAAAVRAQLLRRRLAVPDGGHAGRPQPPRRQPHLHHRHRAGEDGGRRRRSPGATRSPIRHDHGHDRVRPVDRSITTPTTATTAPAPTGGADAAARRDRRRRFVGPTAADAAPARPARTRTDEPTDPAPTDPPATDPVTTPATAAPTTPPATPAPTTPPPRHRRRRRRRRPRPRRSATPGVQEHDDGAAADHDHDGADPTHDHDDDHRPPRPPTVGGGGNTTETTEPPPPPTAPRPNPPLSPVETHARRHADPSGLLTLAALPHPPVDQGPALLELAVGEALGAWRRRPGRP